MMIFFEIVYFCSIILIFCMKFQPFIINVFHIAMQNSINDICFCHFGAPTEKILKLLDVIIDSLENNDFSFKFSISGLGMCNRAMNVISKFLVDRYTTLPNKCGELAHPWAPSCIECSIGLFKTSMVASMKIYSVFYVISILYRMPKRRHINLKKLCTDILRSSLFLSSNTVLFMIVLCFLRILCGCFVLPNLGFFNTFVAAYISILIERKRRRRALAVYVSNLATEILFRMLVHRNIIRPLPYGQVLLTSSVLAAYFYLFRSDKLKDQDARDFIQYDYFHCSLFFIGIFVRNWSCSSCIVICLNSIRSPKDMFKQPISRTVRQLFHYPLILASIPAIYHFLTCIGRRITRKDTPGLHCATIFIAGLLFASKSNTSIAIYLMWKLIDALYTNHASSHKVPSIRHFDSILYAFSTSIIMFAAVIEPQALRKSYWGFLLKLTNGK